MNVRNYNIYFHTHTVSGIIITAILYVIFFAGSFAFFKHEISNWQKNTPDNREIVQHTDFNLLADSLDKKYALYSRDFSFYFNDHSRKFGVNVSEAKDTIKGSKEKGDYFTLDPITHSKETYKDGYDLGEFLYRLHFLAPLNGIVKLGFPIGYYIAGIVAVMFLFALVTGLLLHWNKIVSNFYIFRPREKLKTVWTDLHTALGVVSFPYLLLFSITGAYFLITSVLFVGPAVAVSYGGNQDSLYADLGYGEKEYEFSNTALDKKIDLNAYLYQTQKQWGPDVRLQGIEVVNYGDHNMHVTVTGAALHSKKFTSHGKLTYHVASGKIVASEDPMRPSTYTDVADNLIYILHFGSYGGYGVKILYFLLGICGCVVIISGVLIWQKARDKKGLEPKKKKFNDWLTNIYLSMCLSMFPVTAAAFVMVKFFPNGGMDFIFKFYFWSWLIVTVLLCLRKNNYKTNRDCLLAGSLIGLFVPVANGIVTNNWIWVSFKNRYHDMLLIDIFWLLLSVATFICWRLVVKRNKTLTA